VVLTPLLVSETLHTGKLVEIMGCNCLIESLVSSFPALLESLLLRPAPGAVSERDWSG